MNHKNSIEILQKKIQQLEHTYQERIHQFSTLSMENSALIRQQKTFQRLLATSKQDIKSILVSAEDFDTKIKHQKEQLASELQKEKEFNLMIAEKRKSLKYQTWMKALQQSKHYEVLELINENSAMVARFNAEKEKLLQQIEEYKKSAQQLIQTNEDLSLANETLFKNYATEEKEIRDHFQLRTMDNIFYLNMNELYTIQQVTTQLDLFYATSLRLGVIYHLQKNIKQAFKYFSYLPPEFLEWYQFRETYENIKLELLKTFLLPYSSQVFFNQAKHTSDKHDKEVLLILSLQACSDQNEVNTAAYSDLLQCYLNGEKWLLADLLIKKIRVLDKRTTKSFLPIDKIIQAFVKANLSPIIASKFIKFHQMYTIQAQIPELKHLKPSHPLRLDETVPQIHQDIFFLNDKDKGIECHSIFLKLWRQYQEGHSLIQLDRQTEAIAKFQEILSEHPYFIEAYLKLSECTHNPIWQHLAYQKA